MAEGEFNTNKTLLKGAFNTNKTLLKGENYTPLNSPSLKYVVEWELRDNSLGKTILSVIIIKIWIVTDMVAESLGLHGSLGSVLLMNEKKEP